jgi:hypothetical protein
LVVGFGFCHRSHGLFAVVENLVVPLMLLRVVPLPQMGLETRSWRKSLRRTKVHKESGDSVRVWSKLGLLVTGLLFGQFPAP